MSAHKGGFQKGHPKMGGRKKGTPNAVTKSVRDFFIEVTSDVGVQAAFKEQLKDKQSGALQAFLGAAAHVIGSPKRSVEVSVNENLAELLRLANESREAEGGGDVDA